MVFLIFARSCSPRIYRCQPWTDTAKNICSSFDQYLSDPITFFMRLPGMTLPVANFLVENVFCILDPPTDDSRRIGAREFGVWVRDLPTLMTVSLPVTRTYFYVPSSEMEMVSPVATAQKDHAHHAAHARRQVLHSDVRDYRWTPQTRWHGRRLNYRCTHWPHQDNFRVPRPDWHLSGIDDDVSVGNEEEHDNGEDFFDADSGSYNGPRSIKTVSHSLLLPLATQTLETD